MSHYDVVIFVGNSMGDIFERYAGPQRIATELRNHGISVFVIYGLSYYDSDTLFEMGDKVICEKTLCIGISTTFLLRDPTIGTLNPFENQPKHVSKIQQLLEQFKKKYRKLKAVAGGPFTKEKMAGINLFDAFFEGYSDVSFLTYLQNLKKNKIYLGQQFFRDIEAENFDFKHSTIAYNSDDFIFPNECLPLEIARGCIFKCKFCAYPNIGKNPKDDSWIKSASVLKQELIYNYENFGTTLYTFSDDTYNAGLEKVKMYHEVLTSLPFQIKFSTFIRIDLLYRWPEMITLLLESGLVGAYFGFETFHPYAKRSIGKGLEVSKILRTIEQCNKIWNDDVICTASFIYGLPGETKQTMKDWTENIVIKSGLFDKMSINMSPLFLFNTEQRLYTSEFEREYDLYGYKFIPNSDNPLYWENENTNYEECFQLSNEYLRILYSMKRPYGAFLVTPLIGYGLPMDKIRNRKETNSEVSEITKEKYEIYKNNILNKN